jgi:hypothetical protein
MRYALVLGLLCGCLWAATAAAEPPLTKRNNDASLRRPHKPEGGVRKSPRPRFERNRHDAKPPN